MCVQYHSKFIHLNFNSLHVMMSDFYSGKPIRISVVRIKAIETFKQQRPLVPMNLDIGLGSIDLVLVL
jgi:hypothetical protein